MEHCAKYRSGSTSRGITGNGICAADKSAFFSLIILQNNMTVGMERIMLTVVLF